MRIHASVESEEDAAQRQLELAQEPMLQVMMIVLVLVLVLVMLVLMLMLLLLVLTRSRCSTWRRRSVASWTLRTNRCGRCCCCCCCCSCCCVCCCSAAAPTDVLRRQRRNENLRTARPKTPEVMSAERRSALAREVSRPEAELAATSDEAQVR